MINSLAALSTEQSDPRYSQIDRLSTPAMQRLFRQWRGRGHAGACMQGFQQQFGCDDEQAGLCSTDRAHHRIG